MPFVFDEDDSPVIQPGLLASCDLCGLGRTCASPKMSPTGPLQADLYIMGEAPGVHEDKKGEQFVGPAGERLRQCLARAGILDTSCRLNNALNCYKEGKPEEFEIDYCRERLAADLADAKPKVIIALGGSALKALGYKQRITHMRGRRIVDPRGFWIVPTFHPSYIIRQPQRPDFEALFVNDLALAKGTVSATLPLYADWDQNNYLLTDPVQIHEALGNLEKSEHFIFDFETKYLRPFSDGADLLSVSFSIDGSWGVSFPLSARYWHGNERQGIVDHLLQLFATPTITKVAQKMQFELEWIEHFLGGKLEGNFDCTMLMSYAIDERAKSHNLEFMSKVRLGRGKDKRADKYKSDMSKMALNELLFYGCIDARLEARIYTQLAGELLAQAGPSEVYQRILKPAVVSTVRSQICGVMVDRKLLEHYRDDLSVKMDQTTEHMSTLADVKLFEQQTGAGFRLTDDCVRSFLFDFKGYQSIKSTASDKKQAVDQSVLEYYAGQGDEFCSWYMRYKQILKLKSTYVDGMFPLIFPDGRFHANYNIAVTATGRLSSNKPNMQNFPARDNAWVRRIVTAPPGWVLVSYDFKQIEAIIWALFSGDERFLEVVVEGYDIHYEKAKSLFGIENADEKRQEVKNKFVFPSFFGAGPEGIGANLGLDPEIIKYQQDILWQEFPRIRAKQFEVNAFYQRHLYVETMTGRRRRGPMLYTEVLNAPIQGTASDLTVHAMSRLTDKGYHIPIMIHDDLTFYIRISEFWQRHEEILSVVMNPLYSWVTIPLKVDAKVGTNWCDLYALDSAEGKALLQ